MKFITCLTDSIPCPAEQQSLVSLADLIADAVSQIEPDAIMAAYAFGATSVVTWWGIGFAIVAAQKALSKA